MMTRPTRLTATVSFMRVCGVWNVLLIVLGQSPTLREDDVRAVADALSEYFVQCIVES